MQVSEDFARVDVEVTRRPGQIASWKHLGGFFLITAGITVAGFYSQGGGTGNAAPARQLADHSLAIKFYLSAIFLDCAFLRYCWAGVQRYGGNLETLSGGRWKSWKDIASDVAIAVPFGVVWEATAYGVHSLMGASNAKSVDGLLPRNLVEILLWIVVSITAGFCEELIFRGYLQRQLQALSSGVVAAVVAQGVVFGLAHSYQGWKQIVVISVLGVLYGVLAAWRRNLRVNVITHAATDIWEGWLKMVMWR